ncbi:MAG: ABC transporter substrate-binding protein [Thermoplasmata archaeon]|nr:ABC transporter substrate-binding protein [Thermoplasmata archaeon]
MLALMIVVAFAFSCVPKLANEPVTENVAAAGEDYVSMGTLSSVIYWNPLNIQMVEDYIVTFLVYSSLVTYDENWEGPVNDLATGWYQEVHADETMTTYINITTSAYFRGIDNIDDTTHPLDARDVSYTYNLIKNNSGGTYDWYLEEISYFTAYQNSTSGKWDRVSTWCSYQKATLMDDISSTPILPMYLWGPDGENYEAKALGGMQPEEQIGSGAFVFEDCERDSWYMFKTAPNYHGETDQGPARTVSIPGVLYSVVADTTAMCIEINSGDLDCGVLTGDYGTFQDVLGKDASVNVYKAAVAENGITDIAINAIPDAFDAGGYLNHHPALLDPFVREAIHMTLNRTFIVDRMLGGLPVTAHSVVQPGFWQADIQDKIVYDPAGAKAMLQANGWADSDGDGWLEATATAYGVVEDLFPEGTELSGIRCQAVDTDTNYGNIATAWPDWAEDAGIELIGSVETETTMVNKAWYAADYDIWVWHWGWGPEPIGGALSVWLTSEIEKGGDNCEMPMGPWWAHAGNYTTCPYISAEMVLEYGIGDPDTWNGRFSAFDQNITDAWRILDVDERKVILDKLQQWVYDSNTELIPYYDLGLYGYNDYRFDNWGDWEAHNGLAVVNGLPWIWYMLEPVVDRKPLYNVPPETMYTAYEGVAKIFSAKVSDDEGSPLYVNYTFGDGDVESVYLTGDTTVARWANVTHEYVIADTYTLNVSLTDGFVEDDVVRNLYREAIVEVLGDPNDPATIKSVTRDPLSPATVDHVVTWTATATDPDSGTKATGLKFTWDWGDDTYSVETTATVPDGTAVTSTQTHSWSVPDEYDVTISVYDEYGSELGEHNVSATYQYTIIVNEPPADPTVQ